MPSLPTQSTDSSVLLVQLSDSHLFAEADGKLLGMDTCDSLQPVSYTHLDVYKRQTQPTRATCRNCAATGHRCRWWWSWSAVATVHSVLLPTGWPTAWRVNCCARRHDHASRG